MQRIRTDFVFYIILIVSTQKGWVMIT